MLALARELALRSAGVVAAYHAFPHIVDAIAPLIFADGAAGVSERVRIGLTASFLPGVSLLFGTLFSYTISLLVGRQQRIEELVNQVRAAFRRC